MVIDRFSMLTLLSHSRLFACAAAAAFTVSAPLQAVVTPVKYFRMGEDDPSSTPGSRALSTRDHSSSSVLWPNAAWAVYSGDIGEAAAARVGSTRSLALTGRDHEVDGDRFSGGVDNFGLEGWVKPQLASATSCLFYNGTPGSNGCGIFQVGSTFQARIGASFFGSVPVEAGTWTHLALVRDGGMATFYANGVAVASSDTPVLTATGDFSAGGYTNTPDQLFNGSVDELRIFTFAAGAFTPDDLLVRAPDIGVGLTGGGSLPAGGTADFGIVNPGATSSREIRIANGGVSALTFSASLDGADISSFSSGTVPSQPVTLAPGESRSLEIEFTPLTSGRKTARLRMTSNDPEQGVYDIVLSGTTPGLEISVEHPPGTPLATGQVSVWGSSANTLMAPAGLSGVTALAISPPNVSTHFLALRSDGTVFAWGSNSSGKATPPAGLSGVRSIAAGGNHSVVAKSDGTVVAWGLSSMTTVPVGLAGVVSVAAGYSHSLALRGDGTVAAWGWNSAGQCDVPAGLSGVVSIYCGQAFSVALKSDGTVVTWGSGLPASVPTGLGGVTAIACGPTHVLALKGDGSVVAWGANLDGQATVPAGLSDVVEIAANRATSVALKADGSLISWGSTFSSLNPASQVPVGTPGLRGIKMGQSQLVAIRDSGLSFGDRPVLHPGSPKLVRIRSSSSLPLRVSGASVVGAQAGDFSLTGPDFPLDIPAGGSADLAVSFTPSVLGQRSATLRIANDDPLKGEFNVALSGNGVAAIPDIAVFAGPDATGEEFWDNIGFQTFDETTVDGAGVVKIFTIFNAGFSDLTGLRIREWGPHRDEFILTPPSASSLAPGQSTTFSVRFLPKASGMRSASLWIDSSDWGETPFEINLAGPALGPEIEIGSSGGQPLFTGAPTVWGPEGSFELTQIPPGLPAVHSIAMSENYALALLKDGTVTGWGYYYESKMKPPEGLSGVRAIAAGGDAAFALKEDGTVLAWGSNEHGQMNFPAGLSGVRKIAAAYHHVVALTEDGTMWTWGETLGYTDVPMPPMLTGVVDVAISSRNGVALRTDGSVVVWGDTDEFHSRIPANLPGVVDIAAGQGFFAALNGDGTVMVWSQNYSGVSAYAAPYGLTDVVDIAAVSAWIMARKADGSLVVWGSDGVVVNPPGLGGVATLCADYSNFAAVSNSVVDFGVSAVTLPAAGQSFVIRNTGSLPLNIASIQLVEGDTADFQVGAGSVVGTTIPVGGQASFSASFLPQALGKRSALLRVTSNDHDERSFDILLTGEGVPHVPILSVEESGQQLRDGTVFQAQTAPEFNEPTPVPEGLQDLVSLTCHWGSGLGLKRDGSLVGWGSSPYGPDKFPMGLANVSAIAAGAEFATALKGDGSVVAWGGRGINIPLLPADPGPFIRIAAGLEHVTAIKADGTVVSWYFNSTGGSPPPAGLNDATAVAAGRQHSLALKGNGTVVSWNGYDPVPAGLSGVVAIAAGGDHSLALKNDGTVVGWGSYSDTSAFTPPAGLSGVVAISTSDLHSLALKSDGTVVGWGSNYWGQLNIPPSLRWVKGIVAGPHESLLLMQAHSDFGTRPLPSGGVTKTFTIRNTGSQPLHISGVSVGGGNAADFTVNTSGMLTTVPPGNGTTSFRVKFIPGASGFRSSVLRVLSDDVVKPDLEVRLSGSGAIPATPLEAWRMTHFGIGGNTGVAADDADPNRNGIPNLLEYALGGDPAGSNTGLGILPYLEMDGVTPPTLVFTRDPARNDLILTAQVSAALDGTWTDLAVSDRGVPFAAIAGVGTVAELPAGLLRSVRVSESSATPQTRRFFRLKAVAVP